MKCSISRNSPSPRRRALAGPPRMALTLLTGASIASCLISLSMRARATDGIWIQPVTGLWSDVANWSNGVTADGANGFADFSTLDLSADALVHLDSARTIGNLSFGDSSTITPGGWVLDNNGSGTNVLTLGTSSGISTITVRALATGKTVTLQVSIAGANSL